MKVQKCEAGKVSQGERGRKGKGEESEERIESEATERHDSRHAPSVVFVFEDNSSYRSCCAIVTTGVICVPTQRLRNDRKHFSFANDLRRFAAVPYGQCKRACTPVLCHVLVLRRCLVQHVVFHQPIMVQSHRFADHRHEIIFIFRRRAVRPQWGREEMRCTNLRKIARENGEITHTQHRESTETHT